MSVMEGAPLGEDLLQWGVNGTLENTGDGWQYQPPVGPPGANRGPGPGGLANAVADWYRWLRAHPDFRPS